MFKSEMSTTCKGPDFPATPLLLNKSCALVILKRTPAQHKHKPDLIHKP